MSTTTRISWASKTWSPLIGCERVGVGCANCYAERFVHRGLRPEHRGLTRLTPSGPRWTGEVRLLPARLTDPLLWYRSQTVFVDSLSDVFHAGVPDDFIDGIFAVMALASWHRFLILTKRPQRMPEYIDGGARDRIAFLLESGAVRFGTRPPVARSASGERLGVPSPDAIAEGLRGGWRWPIGNVSLGVSCSTQAEADRDIPPLLRTPAARRVVSLEPLVGPVSVARFLWPVHWHWDARFPTPEAALAAGASAHQEPQGLVSAHARFLDAVILGGESGPGARPCDVGWIRAAKAECNAAGVACHVKQMGRHSYESTDEGRTRAQSGPFLRQHSPWKDSAGSDPAEWPADLRQQDDVFGAAP